MRLATLVDTDALWHVAVYSLLAALGLVTAYGTAVLALDRMDRPATAGGARVAWAALIGLAGLACIALLAVGIWAMTQK
jgi:hypothetical protein